MEKQKSYELTDPEHLAAIDVLVAEMVNLRYAEGTIRDYVRCASLYLSTGRPLTKEAIEQYIQERLDAVKDTPKKRNRIYTIKAAILRFYELVYGGDDSTPRPKKLVANQRTRKVCDEDCFNCKYPDCIFV